MGLKIVVLCLCSFAGTFAQQVNPPTGPIKGTTETTVSGRTYYAYYSIRYAKPPVGSRRFLETELIDAWTDVYDATTENSVICYQLYNTYPEETEDCLYLNVFTPQDPSSNATSLPVMVYIHGGAFVTGSGHTSGPTAGFNPKYWMEEDVVFVSINYRLGAFGFLSTGDDVIPGNVGLKDQILSLKWVQKNIAAFGGDPDKVMIFGESAGGASVGYLVISPAAKGLFRGAILQSGSALVPWAYQRNMTRITYKTGSFVDSQFDTNFDSKQLLEILQAADAGTIKNAQQSFANWDAGQPDAAHRVQMQQGVYFGPVVEVEHDGAFLTDKQYVALSTGNVNKVPIIAGIDAEEGLMILDAYVNYTLTSFDQDVTNLIPGNMHLTDPNTLQTVGSAIKNQYSPTSNFLDNRLGGCKYFTDQDFAKGITKHAELQSQWNDVWFYEFEYFGPMGWNNNNTLYGTSNVTHGQELGYMFRGQPLNWFPDVDVQIHKRFIRMWVNFATYLNPTPHQDELLENVIWPKVKPGNFQYLNIKEDLVIKQGKPRSEGMTFWDNLYKTYGVQPYDSF